MYSMGVVAPCACSSSTVFGFSGSLWLWWHQWWMMTMDTSTWYADSNSLLCNVRTAFPFQPLSTFSFPQFGCCGVGMNGFKDWSENPYFNCTDSNPSPERCAVPYSCCRKPDDIRVSDRGLGYVQWYYMYSRTCFVRPLSLSPGYIVPKQVGPQRHVRNRQ